jgi:hypothetical protein
MTYIHHTISIRTFAVAVRVAARSYRIVPTLYVHTYSICIHNKVEGRRTDVAPTPTRLDRHRQTKLFYIVKFRLSIKSSRKQSLYSDLRIFHQSMTMTKTNDDEPSAAAAVVRSCRPLTVLSLG